MSGSLSPAEVGLSVVVTRGGLSRLEVAMEAMLADEVLTAMPWTFLTTEECRPAVLEVLGERPARLVTIPEDRRSVIVAAVLEDVRTAPSRATVPVMLPRAREVHDLAEAVMEVTARLGNVLEDEQLLLPVALTPKGVMPELIRRRLTSVRGIDPLTKALVEESSTLTSSARMEYIDPVPGAIRVGVWLGQVLPPELPESPWRFEVALLNGTRVVAVSAPGSLTRRVDRFGVTRWDEVIVEIPMSDVPTGNYTLGIRVHGLANTEFARLRARKGALAGARVRSVPEDGPDRTSYVLNSAPRGATMYLTVDRGPAASLAERWRSTLRRKDLNFVVRGRASRQVRRLRLQRMLTRPLFHRREIWLVGERPDTAQDNGSHLFRYLRTEAPEREVYYVIRKDSVQRERLAGLGNVVDHSSRRHRLLMLHAKVLANAYSINHMIPSGWEPRDYEKHLAWRIGARRIYLKHGVHLSPNAVERGLSGYDLLLAATHDEAAEMRRVTGYVEEVAETGLPRYDALERSAPTRTVLFMSTWRRYLVPHLFGKGDGEHEAFDGSSYEAFVRAFLASGRLHEMLARHDYRLSFLPHYNLASLVSQLPTAGDRVTIADPDAEPIQAQLQGCDAFITDYSSVHFDVAYVGTPVIYARFDEEEFETKHASSSWFDYDTMGFGPVTRTLDETLDALEAVLARGCTVEPRYAERADRSFVHRDRSSCARVVQRIDALLEDDPAGRPG